MSENLFDSSCVVRTKQLGTNNCTLTVMLLVGKKGQFDMQPKVLGNSECNQCVKPTKKYSKIPKLFWPLCKTSALGNKRLPTLAATPHVDSSMEANAIVTLGLQACALTAMLLLNQENAMRGHFLGQANGVVRSTLCNQLHCWF